MQWIIENGDVPMGAVDDNSLRLLEVVKAKNLPWVGVGYMPFVKEITGLGEADPSVATMYYGSTQGTSIMAKLGVYRPGVFWDYSWWDPRTWIGKRTDLLNSEITTLTAADLRSSWIDRPMFCKSVAVKEMTGDVLEVSKQDKDDWTIEFSHLDGDAELLLSEPVRLKGEWRFFVVGGDVISGSTYRLDGVKRRMVPIPDLIWRAVRKAVGQWMPCQDIVIDLCLTEDDEVKVVEFNAINSSGWYNTDIGLVVDALEERYGDARIPQLD